MTTGFAGALFSQSKEKGGLKPIAVVFDGLPNIQGVILHPESQKALSECPALNAVSETSRVRLVHYRDLTDQHPGGNDWYSWLDVLGIRLRLAGETIIVD